MTINYLTMAISPVVFVLAGLLFMRGHQRGIQGEQKLEGFILTIAAAAFFISGNYLLYTSVPATKAGYDVTCEYVERAEK